MLNFRWVFPIVAICFSIAAHAEFHVMPLEPGLDMSAFEKEGYTIDKPEPDGVLPSHSRDDLFQQSGLVKDVEGWDAYEKDMFTLRSGVHPLARMKSWYPKISEAKIKKHQTLVSKLKGKK